MNVKSTCLAVLTYNKVDSINKPQHKYTTRFREKQSLQIPANKSVFTSMSTSINSIRLFKFFPTEIRAEAESATEPKKLNKLLKKHIAKINDSET